MAANNKRHTTDDYRTLAQKRGFDWLGPEVLNSKAKTWWQCPVKHRFQMNYNNLSQGQNCPYCSINKDIKTTEHYHALAADRGFVWLGEVLPKNSQQKTMWRCSHGHEFQMAYQNMSIGKQGCVYCAGLAPKTSEDYENLANSKGFKWLGDEAVNTRTLTLWECLKGHKFQSRYNNIRQGRGCPYCAGLARKTAADFHELAKKRGFQWIGEIINTTTPTLWRCSKGHEWYASYNAVGGKLQTGCPHCDERINGMYVSKQQIQIANLIKGELNKRVGKWCVDTAICVEGINIAIEYDAWYWHQHRTEFDLDKSNDLINKDWRVLRILSAKKIPSIQQLQGAIARIVAGEKYIEIILDDWGNSVKRKPLKFSLGSKPILNGSKMR